MASNHFSKFRLHGRRPKVCDSKPVPPRHPPIVMLGSLLPALVNLPLAGTQVFDLEACDGNVPTGTAITVVMTPLGGTFAAPSVAPTNCSTVGKVTYTAGATPGTYSQDAKYTSTAPNEIHRQASVKIWDTVTVCAVLNPAPARWTFDLSTVTNGTCTMCANENRTWTLVNIGGCTWQETGAAAGPCSPFFKVRATFAVTAGATSLTFRAAGAMLAAVYAGPAATDYRTPVTVSLTVDNLQCAGWPATIIVSPVG